MADVGYAAEFSQPRRKVSARNSHWSLYSDFAWLSARIIIEVDGDTHATDANIKHDEARDEFLRRQGFCVLRFNNNNVIYAEKAVYLEIEAVLQSKLVAAPAS